MARKKRKGPSVGVSIFPDRLEIAFFNPLKNMIEQSQIVPLPNYVIMENGDRIGDLNLLVEAIRDALGQIKPKVRTVNLSLTATLLRMVEMPKMEARELYLSLSSEAERYKSFDDTEAIVDFHVLPDMEGGSPSLQRVIFGAIRKDTFDAIKRAFQVAKVKIASVDLEPLNLLRAMATAGVLDNLVRQIGEEAYWGTVFVEPERVRFSLWQANQIVELREVSMATVGFSDPNAPFVFDVVDEIRRTTKTTIPAIWLTYNMPDNMIQGLREQLGVPVMPCLGSEGISLDNPDLSLVVLGACQQMQVEFPFNFNLLTGASQAATLGKKDVSPSPVVEEEEGLLPNLLIAGGVLLTVLCLLIWGGMVVFDTVFMAGKIQELEQRQVAKLNEKVQWEQQIKRLQKQKDMREMIAGVMAQARTRNAVYKNLSEDLKNMTPDTVWLYNIEVGDNLLLEGKALTHQSIIRFAQQFDALLYAKEVLISSIEEQALGSSKVFNFEIKAQTAFDPKLIEKRSKKKYRSDTMPGGGSDKHLEQGELDEINALEEPDR